MRYAQVYLNTAQLSLDRPFDYYIPDFLDGKIAVGMRVKVLFGGGNRPKEGFVVGISDASPFEELKPIIDCIDAIPLLDNASIALAREISRKYYCPFVAALKLLLPAGIDTKYEEWLALTGKHLTEEGRRALKRSEKQERAVMLLQNEQGSMEFSQFKAEMGAGARAIVSALVKKGILEISRSQRARVREKTVRVAYYCGSQEPLELAEQLSKRNPAQAKVLELLSSGEEYSVPDIVMASGAGRNAVEALVKKGLVAYRDAQVLRSPFSHKEESEPEPPLVPTSEQRAVIETVKKAESGVFLIHGVTGSGKTEIYMQIIDAVIKQGKQAIVLVPEIALTPQITNRFYARFGNVVAVLHSALSLGERLDEWRRIKSGAAKVVIGARSAVFAPFNNLGIIIVDEEHETSYKSETMPRYHAVDIAKMRAERAGCPLVMASATPSVESYYKTQTGDYALLTLTKRHNDNPLPEVTLADMRKELEEGNRYMISRRLASEIHKNLQNGEQTVLFLNRRGYFTFVSCRSCGYVFCCPNCSVSLTHHAAGNTLNCHLCGYRRPAEARCPSCGSDKVKAFGGGTQKAQDQLAQVFPAASILRMDADTTAGKRGHEKILEQFEKEKIDILLGTQMVSKGLDFPSVTLVGVLAADASLYADDFRSQERTFNLITQVCGRAGRGDRRGRAVVQTYMPENPTLLLAKEQDYKAFYEQEISYRKTFSYPPFQDIINIIIASRDYETARAASARAAQEIKAGIAIAGEDGCELFGPSAAPIAKIEGRFRFRIWIKCSDADSLRDVLKGSAALTKRGRQSDITVSIDVNPYSMN